MSPWGAAGLKEARVVVVALHRKERQGAGVSAGGMAEEAADGFGRRTNMANSLCNLSTKKVYQVHRVHQVHLHRGGLSHSRLFS